MKQPGHVALKALKLFTHFTPQQKERSISPKGPTSSASHSFFQRLDGTWSQVYAAEFSAGWTMNCGAITVCHHGVVRKEGTTNPVVQDLNQMSQIWEAQKILVSNPIFQHENAIWKVKSCNIPISRQSMWGAK
jgi:hypothetical protein